MELNYVSKWKLCEERSFRATIPNAQQDDECGYRQEMHFSLKAEALENESRKILPKCGNHDNGRRFVSNSR